MPRPYVFIIVLNVGLAAGPVFAQSDMKPTAPEKMMPPAEKVRLDACQKKAAQENVRMDERARFVMDCMKKMAK